ncbi:MAG TPA: response regulator transcription factor [Vicinamibacterales bacterium]|nr:response regulator transcription factor [Vicinamibacterales bacterium]
MSHRVLVVEDNPDIAYLLELHLRDLPCEVDVARDGLAALDAARARPYDAIVLDIMLPRLDGLAVCRAIRQERIFTPILMLTARTTELDRVLGLELGADDYLAKPFSVPELLARVKAFFRRAEAYSPRDAAPRGAVLTLDELAIDVDRRAVTLAGASVTLTAKESTCCCASRNIPGACIHGHSSSIWCGGTRTRATGTPSTHTSTGCGQRSSAMRASRDSC